MIARLLLLLMLLDCLMTLGRASASAQPRFQTFFLSVGNSNYVSPASPELHGFGELSGANSSARVVADIISKNGAVAGITVTSSPGRFVSKADFDRALSDLIERMKSTRATNPLLVVYFAGHGISEGVAWNHFSVPGPFVHGNPLDRLDVEELAQHTIHAAALAEKLGKTGVPFLLLLDTCYEGQPASFESPVLSPGATRSLEQVAGIMRFMNEFHGSNPVIFSAEPGREVPLAPDPRHPDQASLGPIGRRLLLLASKLGSSGGRLTLSGVVAQLTSASLDPATSPPITHAEAPKLDGILLGPSTSSASIETRTGTATSKDICCGTTANPQGSGASGSSTVSAPPAGIPRLRGSLTFQGPPGEFISDGARVTLPPGTPVTVAEPDARSLELSFATHDGWELDLSAPEESKLGPATYTLAVRYPFQEGNQPGLALNGAGRGCNEVAGEFTVTKLRRDQSGHLLELLVTFIQRCDSKTRALSGSVSVGEQ